MAKSPTDNLLWLLMQAYRAARKRGLLPPHEPPPAASTTGTPPALPEGPSPEPDEPTVGPALETSSVMGWDSEDGLFSDPTESEGEAGQRLVQAVVREVVRRPRRQRLFAEGGAAEEPPAEEPLPQLKTRLEELADYFAQRKEFKSLDMYYLVIYDIQDNRIRTHLFNYLKERGLYHLQKSVFLGRNDRAAYQRIYETVRRIERKLVETDSIVFLPVAENELRKFRIVGRDVEVSAVLDEPHTLVF